MISVFRIPEIARDAVHYHPLEGQTLRQAIRANTPDQDMPHRLGQFVANLHQKGVYFRSLHLGNILLTPNDSFGLIDISDMKLYPGPLARQLRLRNLRRLYSDPQDAGWFTAEHHRLFELAYVNKSI